MKLGSSGILLAAVLLTGCASRAPVSAAPPGVPYPPESCAGIPADAPLLKLAPTRLDRAEPGSFAQQHRLGRSLTRAGEWTDTPQGWSTLVLVLHSQDAQSLSAQLREVVLPRRSEIWICSADGRQRHGPFREATGGQLWTPIVTGERMQLQVWVPTASRAQFKAELAEAQSGYR